MCSYLSIRLLALAFFVTLLFTYSSGHGHSYDPFTGKPHFTHHGGPILNGTVKVAIVWYGEFDEEIGNVLRSFIKSIDLGGKVDPKVSTWWDVVESYQSMVPNAKPGPPPKINVNLVKEFNEREYKFGKVLTLQIHMPQFIHHVTGGDKTILPVIIGAKDVTIQGLCFGKCYDHCLTDDGKDVPFIVLADLETECPGECVWPFVHSDYHPEGPVLKPPGGSAAAHAVVTAFASALVDTVLDPMNNGIYHENKACSLGPAAVCKGIFGPGASPGNPGKVLTDPKTHGNYNAHGENDEKYLLPAIWNLQTKSCWTVT